MRLRPSTISRVITATADTQPKPVSATVRAVGAAVCDVTMADNTILRGLRIVGARPALGAPVWVMWDASARPYVTATGEGGGSGGGVAVFGSVAASDGVAPHDLDDTSIHGGVLANGQAPQFVLLDGSRAVEGYLALQAALSILEFIGTSASAKIESDGDVIRLLARVVEAAHIRGGLVDAPVVKTEFLNALGVQTQSLRFVPDQAMGVEQWGGFDMDSDAFWIDTSRNVIALAKAMAVNVGGNYFAVAPDGSGATIDLNATSRTLTVNAILNAAYGVRTRTTAGAPTGGSSGDIAVDTTNSRIYVNVSGTWKYASLT